MDARDEEITENDILSILRAAESKALAEETRVFANELLLPWKLRYFVRLLDNTLRESTFFLAVKRGVIRQRWDQGYNSGRALLPLATLGENACPVTKFWYDSFCAFISAVTSIRSGGTRTSALVGPGPLQLVEFAAGGDAGDRAENPTLVQTPIPRPIFETLRQFFGGDINPPEGLVFLPHIPGAGLSSEPAVETHPWVLNVRVQRAHRQDETFEMTVSRTVSPGFIVATVCHRFSLNPPECSLCDFAGESRNAVLWGGGVRHSGSSRLDKSGIVDGQWLLLEHHG
jgi:hypothetical protein